MSGKVTFFSRVGKTRIIPIGLKMLLIFICLILLSNFITNFISLQLNQRQIINLNNTIMVSQLKELYNTSSNQYQIYFAPEDMYDAIILYYKTTPTQIWED